MPTNPPAYRPVHMPFFVSDGSGGLRLDSAGSQANVNLQNLLLERAKPVAVPEHVEHVDRQETLNKFLQKHGGETQYHRPRPGVAFPLPRVASPQRMHVDFRTRPQQSIAADRAHQLQQLKGTIIGTDLERRAYSGFDRVLKECHSREDQIISFKKGKQNLFEKVANKEFRFAQEDKNWIYTPLYNFIDASNAALEEHGIPMQFVFRETWKTETSKEIDLWAVYANDTVSAKKGIGAWMGSRDITDPQAKRP